MWIPGVAPFGTDDFGAVVNALNRMDFETWESIRFPCTLYE